MREGYRLTNEMDGTTYLASCSFGLDFFCFIVLAGLIRKIISKSAVVVKNLRLRYLRQLSSYLKILYSLGRRTNVVDL